MNPIDLLIGAALVLAVVTGLRSGFIATLYGLATWIASLVLALSLLAPVADLAAGFELIPEPASRAISFLVLLLGFETALGVLGRFVVWPVVKVVHAYPVGAAVDRVLGVVPAVLRTLVVLAVGLAALVVLPVGNDVRVAVDRSRVGSALVAEVAAVQPYLGRLLGSEGVLLVTKIDAEGRHELDIPEGIELEEDVNAEVQMVEMVNAERAALGLATLTVDAGLTEVARAHSAEMFWLRYFSHQSPLSGSPFDRLAAAGIEYQRAGENLAYAQSVAVAHRGLMASPGHRENILRPEFTHIGVGVISGGSYGRMFTQVFLTPP